MKKQRVFNGLMVLIFIAALLPVGGPLAAGAATEPVQGMKATETLPGQSYGRRLGNTNDVQAADFRAAAHYPAGMISYWKFDEGSGAVISDVVGTNNGNITNPDWSADCRIGECLQSSPRGSTYVNVPNSPSLNPASDQLTVEAWVYPFASSYQEGQGNGGFVAMKEQYGLCVGGWWAGKFQFVLDTTTNGWKSANSPGDFPANTWYHMAGVYDGTAMRLYVNGILTSTVAQTGTLRSGSGDFWIGHACMNNGYDNCYTGKIDEVAIYTRALSAEEIQQHYQNGLNGLGYDAPAPLTGATITGPTAGTVDTAYTFTAAVNATATLPITYSWQADGQSPVIHTDRLAYTDAVTFTWSTEGTKTITVTASNAAGAVQTTAVVSVLQPRWQVARIPNLPPDWETHFVWTSGANDAYIMAQRVAPGSSDIHDTAVYHWNGTAWSAALTLPGHTAASVYGVRANEVYVGVNKCATGDAAGCGTDKGGYIFRSTDGGATWITQTLPAEVNGYSLVAIQGTPNNIHAGFAAASYRYYIARYDGASWTAYAASGLTGPAILSETEGYYTNFAGWGKWTGTDWQYFGEPFCFCDLYDTWGLRDGSGSLHLYTVGNNSFSNGVRVWKFNEAAQSFGGKYAYVFAEGSGSYAGNAWSIWGAAADDIYVAGIIGNPLSPQNPSSGRLYHYDGSRWQRITALGQFVLARDVYGSGADNVWATTLDGNLLHYYPHAPLAPAGLTIAGAATALPNTSYTFTATVTSDQATAPVTYTVQATDQSPATTAASMLYTAFSFAWTTGGIKTITVTAQNEGGVVTNTSTINVVNWVVPDNYATIQAAIDAANPGDTIYVRAGTYHEHLSISKAITLTGENRATAIIDGGSSGDGIYLNANGAVIKSLTVQNANVGLRLYGATNNLIADVRSMSNALQGLVFYNSADYNTVSDSFFTNNGECGADAGDQGSDHTTFQNVESSSNVCGIGAYAGSNYTQILNSRIHNNTDSGIRMGWSSSWQIESSSIYSNSQSGISIDTASSGNIAHTTIYSNLAGISFMGFDSSNVTIANNRIYANQRGVILYSGGHSNTITANEVYSNSYGIYVGINSSYPNYGNAFYHNTLWHNTVNAQVDQGDQSNAWDDGAEGNYWSDYTGVDANHDGIGDTPYVITSTTNVDRYPLVNVYTLTVAAAGNGSGIVTPTVGAHTYTYGTGAPVAATASAGSTFTGWSGDLSGSATPTSITMDGDKSITATFNLITYTLTVSKAGAGSGTVSSNPAGINCGADCAEGYAFNTTVTLTATPAGDSTFASWNGCDSVSGDQCTVTMSQAQSVTATFNIPPTGVTISGPTAGTVDTAYTFTAAVNATATLPITYSWQADGQSPVIHTDSLIYTDAVTFTWSTEGAKAMTVTASNAAGAVQTTAVVSVLQPRWQVARIPNLAPDWEKFLVWTSGVNDTYVMRVGTGSSDIYNTVVYHWNGTAWSTALTLPGHDGSSVYGASANDVYVGLYKCATGNAAGCGADKGARIFRSTDGGATWITQTLPAEVNGYSLVSIQGTPNNIHAAFSVNTCNAYIARYDGASWTPYAATVSCGLAGPTILSDIEGYYTSCWGWSKWTGTGWQYSDNQFDFCDTYDTWGLRDGSGNLHLYTVGNNNFSNGVRVWKFNEAAQSFGSKYGYVFAEGSGSYAGNAWSIWGAASDDIYVAGIVGDVRDPQNPSSGRLYHYDGSSWQRLTALGQFALAYDVYGSGADNVWATTLDGNLLHYYPHAPLAPAGLIITGAATALPHTSYTFTATVTSDQATAPVTYTVEATDQAPVTTAASMLYKTFSFTWTTGGIKTITVTASNAGGTVSDTHVINVINTYLITPTAGANGSLTPGTPQTVNHGDSQTFTVAATTAGYHIADVGVDGVSQGPIGAYTFTNVTANHTITAAFAINTYLITPTAGANGSLTPGTPQTVNHGDSQTFTVAATTAGYHIADVGVDGVSQGPIGAYTFTNVTANHTITAAFAIDTYTLTITAAGNGSGVVTPTAGTHTYGYGTVVTLTATANTGSTFTGWSGAIVTTTSSVTATMTANKIVTATFAQRPIHIIVLAAFDNGLDPQSADVIENIRQGTAVISTTDATLLIDGAGIGDTRVLEIAGGVITQTNVPTFTGELDTANPDVIAAFLTWARAQHPDARIVVALLGHGVGLTPELHSPLLSGEGPGVRSHVPLPMKRDPTPMDVTSGTYLSTPEFGRALDAATNHGAKPFDALFLDQCFSGGLDTLVEIRAAASIFVASPNYAWGAFAYDRYLPHFTPAATPEDMAQAIVNEYEAALDDMHPNAIFWLRDTDIAAIANALSNLGDVLRTAPTAEVLAAALNSQFVDTSLCANDWRLCPPDEEIGLRSFAAQLQSRATVGSAVYTKAGEVLTALAGVHSNTAHTTGAPWPKPESQWNLADLGPTIVAPLTRTLAASGDIWRASLYTSTVPLTATLKWLPTQTVVITTPWAATLDSGWARFLSTWYGPLTPTIGMWCNGLPPALVITGTEPLTLTAQGGLVSARLVWTPVVTSTAVDYAVYVLRPSNGTWELAASVPLTQTTFTHTGLPSGVYRYFVAARNDQAQVVAFSDKASVEVGVTSIDPGYGLNSVPTMAYLYGSGFEAPITVTIGSAALPDVLVIDPHTLHAVIPAGLTPGLYDVTVSAAAGQAVAHDAFRVINAQVVDDLVSSADQLATDPLTVRANHAISIAFAFQRLGGKFTLKDDVTIAIQVNGALLDNTWAEPAPPDSTASASPLSWLPPAPGDYEICAIIDPANAIAESDETNNTVCNTITVLPPGDDTIPPVVDGFVIDRDASIAAVLTATLTVTATDYPLPYPSGVKCVKFYEYEWSQGVRRWLPVTRSGCVDYAASPTDYPWQLLNVPGLRYMTAWAQDNAGNISLKPGIDTINLAPAAQAGYAAQNGVVSYRFYVRRGQPVVVRLTSVDGDADLYVWGPGDQLWYSNNQAGLEDRVAFNAPVTATYQIEVHGYTAAHYRLTFGSGSGSVQSALGSPSSLTAKPLPDAPAVPLDSWPNGRYVRPPDWPDTQIKIYLPIVMR